MGRYRKLRCPFCRDDISEKSEGMRYEHRIKCQVLRDETIKYWKGSRTKTLKPIRVDNNE